MKFWNRTIPDPIRGLTLERLSRQLDAYNNGYLAEFALTAEAMEQRDDILKNVILKRKKAVARHGWAVLVHEDSPEAGEHKAALDFFYRNLKCSHVLKQDLNGGFNLLVHQMMDAVGKGWAVHEITWQPRTTLGKGQGTGLPRLSAELRFVPLWFFENTVGKLRFLSHPFATHGDDLAPREWLVSVGEGLMVACSRAFLFKHFPLQAWLDYCQKYGTPGLRGITSAARGTPEWTSMEESLEEFMEELAVVTNSAESIELIDLKGRGEPPFHALVDRMDRTMAALWRGADLSTISRDQGYGASLQEQESRLIEVDDAEMVSSTLNNTLDRWVIEYLFGKAVVPKAYVKILVSPKECTPHDLSIDEFLVAHGAKLSLAKALERYGRAGAQPGEAALEAKSFSNENSRRRDSEGMGRFEHPNSLLQNSQEPL